ncbi:signal transduction histidine kinase [Altererythrobacter atlanticus]|nr:hypothetical protein [Croceibacterium atlanticum]MBB5731914.1 signal transduction histidine kinase [Croceibacterium atlanticum]
MKRLLAANAAIFALPAMLALSATPAAAQEAGERVNTVIIYGDDECPQSTPDQITVCARMDESERYRIPERLRQSDDPANQSWAQRVQSYEAVGKFGPLSCSTIGAGSELGCTAAMIETAYAERAQSSNVRFSELIAEARQERLSTIDEEAAATQARVEELERQYEERRRAEGGEGPETPADPSSPQVVDTENLPPPQN